MYGPLWRILPGPWPVKVLISLVLVATVVVVCFLWLFPAIAQYVPFNGNSVQTGLSFLTSPTAPTIAI